MKERIVVGSAVGGMAILVAVALVVFQFGRTNPSPPSLIDSPNPAIPGELLFRDEDECIVRAAASGASREQVYCGMPPNLLGVDRVVWVDANTIGFTAYTSTSQMLVNVDLATKQVVGEQPIATGKDISFLNLTARDGSTVSIDDGGVVVVTKGGQRTEAWDTGMETWRVQPLLWSPDSQWIVLFYSPPRGDESELWLIKRDGSVRGTIATDVGGQSISWRIDGVGITPELE